MLGALYLLLDPCPHIEIDSWRCGRATCVQSDHKDCTWTTNHKGQRICVDTYANVWSCIDTIDGGTKHRWLEPGRATCDTADDGGL